MAQSIPSTFKIKFENNGEMKRFPASNSLAETLKHLSDCWGAGTFVLTYLDEDNDLIKVSNEVDLQEAILVARDMGSRVLKFTASLSSNMKWNNPPVMMQPRICATEIQAQINKVNLHKQTKLQSPKMYPPKYLSMLNAGVPKNAIIQKMKLDGYDLGYFASDLRDILRNGHVNTEAPAPYCTHYRTQATGVPLVSKSSSLMPPIYNKMLRAGVPWEAVVQKMKHDGYESSSLTCQYSVVNTAMKKRSACDRKKPVMVVATSPRVALCADIRKGVCLRSTFTKDFSSPSLPIPASITATRKRVVNSLKKSRPHTLRKVSSAPCRTSYHHSNSLSNKLFLSEIRGFSPEKRLVSPKPQKQVSFANVVAHAIPSRSAPSPVPAPLNETATTMNTSIASMSMYGMVDDVTDKTSTTATTQSNGEVEAKTLQFMAALDRLEAMGFSDRQKNSNILDGHDGSVERTINSLLCLH